MKWIAAHSGELKEPAGAEKPGEKEPEPLDLEYLAWLAELL